MSVVMLAGVILASLACGVLSAYAICQVMFRIFRMHALSSAKPRPQAAAGLTASSPL